MEWTIPKLGSDQPLTLPLGASDRLFVVGANGSGKSALIQHFVSTHDSTRIKRISAHRQTWLSSSRLNFTAESRRQFDENNRVYETRPDARWMDHNAEQRQSAVLFDLVAKENARARRIAGYIDKRNPVAAIDAAGEIASPFKQLNELLAFGTLTISLENSNDEEILARKGNSEPFSFAKMSDGERNAAIIAADVLTVRPGTVLLIDEPERHLHRSIIEPFLSALFACRDDCIFVISTHDLALPISNPEARILMIRSCEWKGDQDAVWDIEILAANSDLPDDLKLAILGARRKILFVEGTSSSLDISLYGALYPDVTTIPKGNCSDVQNAVRGLRSSRDLHYVDAFGIIDRDNLGQEKINQLAGEKVFPLDVHSVEALYYCSDAISVVARWQAESLGSDPNEMIRSVKTKSLTILSKDDVAERMAARRCEGQMRNAVMAQLPDWKSIRDDKVLSIDVDPAPYLEELKRFNKLVREENLDDLVARYPLRETQVFNVVAQELQCRTKKNYEQMVTARVRHNPELAQLLRQRINPLSTALENNWPDD